MTWWYGTSFLLLVGVLGYAPDTRISTWASQEAKARLVAAEQGQVSEFEFGVHYQNVAQEHVRDEWDKFTIKSLKMNDEDDDEEEEENEEEDQDEDDE